MINIALSFAWIWQTVNSSPVLSSLLSALIIGLFLIFFFRTPDFQMSVYARLNKAKNGSIFFDIGNKKRFMAYDADDVFYKVYIPERFFAGFDCGIEQSTISGWEAWNPLHNLRDKDRFVINGETYIVINGISRLSLFPEQKVTLFRVNGNFKQKSSDYKIYFQVRTRYGFYPYFVRGNHWFPKRFVGKQSDVLKGKLPNVVLTIQ